MNYTGPDSVKFVASGTGGLEELKSHLKEDEVQYAKVLFCV